MVSEMECSDEQKDKQVEKIDTVGVPVRKAIEAIDKKRKAA